MIFGVPQFINIEDKVAGPLTGKQLLWMIGMGAALLVLWNTLEDNAFFVAAIPVVLIFCAFAFYRPYEQSMVEFVGHSVIFLFQPKIYIWKRTGEPEILAKIQKTKISFSGEEKKYTSDDFGSFADLLDSDGGRRGGKIMNLIDEREKKKHKKKFPFLM